MYEPSFLIYDRPVEELRPILGEFATVDDRNEKATYIREIRGHSVE